MLYDIIGPFCEITGYNPVADRATVLRTINIAAKEVYDSIEPDRALSEVVLVVPKDLQLTLPNYMGEVRGIREYKYSTPIPLHSIGSPQYSSSTWQFLWRNWRQKGISPIHTSLTNDGPLTLETPFVETTLTVVAITMSTTNSDRVVERVTLDATVKVMTNSPVVIYDISTASVGRQYNVTLKDVNAVEVAVLSNNQPRTRYQVVDVSQYQWTSAFANNGVDTLCEVLFKPIFSRFYNDTDEFIAQGYDDTIVYKAIARWLYGQEGKEADVLMYEKKSVQALDLAQRSQEAGEDKQIIFAKNPVYNAFNRLKNKGWWNNSMYGCGAGVGSY